METIADWNKAQAALEEWRLAKIEAHKHLKPPKNYRAALPRCCFTCKYFIHSTGTSDCVRPDGPEWDTGDMEYVFSVCDYWKYE